MQDKVCSICQHKDIGLIDEAMRRGVSTRQLERRFAVGRASVSRHRKHMTPANVQAPVMMAAPVMAAQIEAAETTLAAIEPSNPSAIGQVREVCRHLRSIGMDAKGKGNHGIAVQAFVAELRGHELEAKLSGELEQQPTVFNFAMIDGFVRAADLKARTINAELVEFKELM
jgi:hypothetical protein